MINFYFQNNADGWIFTELGVNINNMQHPGVLECQYRIPECLVAKTKPSAYGAQFK